SDVKKINERGIEYGKQGKYDEAIKEFHKVVAIEPDIANVHYNLGLAYKKKGMNDEADKEFAEYERLSKAGH
ncbi:MAG: tetratricopeptide repeat protein, partial [Planctomycetota bacterium]